MLELTIIGNLGRDAERKEVAGRDMVVLRVASTFREKTTWVTVFASWSYCESIMPFLVRGKQVYVHGRMSVRDSEYNGVHTPDVMVNAQSINLCGSNTDGQRAAAQAQAPAPAPTQQPNGYPQQGGYGQMPTDDNGDLPF